MKKRIGILGILLAGFVFSSVIHADNVIISGEIFGTETLAPEPSWCGSGSSHPHHLVGPIRVSSSGTYNIVDGGFTIALATQNTTILDISTSVYQGSYNINNPNANLIVEADDVDEITLNSGTDYYFVIQPICSAVRGVYAITISGPGDITGTGAIAPYDYMQGEFINSDPVGNITGENCVDRVYNVSDPFQVSRSGTHYFADIAEDISLYLLSPDYVDSTATFYNGPFDPDNPASNRMGTIDIGGPIDLVRGTEYRVVMQPECNSQGKRGEWFFVLLNEKSIPNHALSGAWFNPETSGQGILMEIYEQSKFAFMAWFTYDTSQPDPGVPYQVGHSGHRWLTAQGNYSPGSNSITIPVYLVSGGLFDDPTAVNPAEEEGSITVTFQDCMNATVSYQLTAANVSGNFSMIRILNDNASYCASTDTSMAPFENSGSN
ncbi:hypothetical protein ACFL1V_07245 [Pseudomonadota bacterium]